MVLRRPETVAIDGPAAAGKSTVGKLLADHLGYVFVDTGQLYRAITASVISHDVDPGHAATVTSLAQRAAFQIDINPSNQRAQITFEQRSLDSMNLHSEAINRQVAIVAAHRTLRVVVRDFQLRIARLGHVVLAGRDIGTVVLPNADLKIYLNASLRERARRRYAALESGAGTTFDQVLDDVCTRDHLDSTRPHSPLKIAEDAIVICTDELSPEQVLARIVDEFVDM